MLDSTIRIQGLILGVIRGEKDVRNSILHSNSHQSYAVTSAHTVFNSGGCYIFLSQL